MDSTIIALNYINVHVSTQIGSGDRNRVISKAAPWLTMIRRLHYGTLTNLALTTRDD